MNSLVLFLLVTILYGLSTVTMAWWTRHVVDGRIWTSGVSAGTTRLLIVMSLVACFGMVVGDIIGSIVGVWWAERNKK